MNMDDMREKAHYVSITGIIVKDRKFLICKRSLKEKNFPGKWCVPGGKIEQKDFINCAKDTNDHWLDIFEKVLKKEVLEETNVKIRDIGYVSSLVFIRPNGFSTIIVSLYALYDSGDVKMMQPDELVEYAWVDLEHAKKYDLIENIYEQLVKVDKIINSDRY
jgi:8-oxo-dGTP pyrophosphatase MutT (NUDIX family)